MSRFLVCGDLHVHNYPFGACPTDVAGVNSRAMQTLNCVDAVMGQALKHRCDAVIFLGDIFDNHKPSVQLQIALGNIIGSTYLSHPTKVWLKVGNHDRGSMAPNDHALAMFAFVPGCSVVEEPVRLDGLVMIPWSTNSVREDIIQSVQNRSSNEPLTLLLHAGLYDKSEGFKPEQGDTKGHDAIEVNDLADLCRKYNIRRVFSGHWHAYREYCHGPDLTITQLGSLVPTGFNNAEHPRRYGQCVIVNDDLTIEPVIIPGPRFFRGATVAEISAQFDNLPLEGRYPVYASVKPPVDQVAQVRKDLEAMVADGWLQGFAVEPAIESVRSQADSVRASISRDSAQEAIEDYIVEMAPTDDIAATAAGKAVSAWKKA